MNIVIYRPHGHFNFQTQYFGPFDSYDDAVDFLTSLPALGTYDFAYHEQGEVGVKYIATLTDPNSISLENLQTQE